MTDDLDARYRLPRTAIPSAYRLRLEPDLDALTFSGSVEIDVEVAAPSSTVVLNSLELDLDDPTVTQHGVTQRGTATLDADLERATLTFPDALATGPATLGIAFQGVLNDQLVGFYRSVFTDDEGVEHTVAASQLCVTDARRAFPCFDEPSFKATFEVTLVAPGDLAAFSNSPSDRTSVLDDGRREVHFSPTMKLSTYLVAFCVGDLESSPTIDVDGVPLTTVCTAGKVHLTSFAQEVGAFALRFFSDYFAIPYPGDKVDLVGIPDFAHGAMENLGCVMFRETALLVDESTASKTELERVAMVVAHELAHMWFGDLVTMQWWEGLWLNEAFATFLQYLCIDAFRPEWKVWIEFSEEREVGLAVDGLHTTRPIEFEVHSPSDAMSMIDVITYQKGGSVLRMLEQYLGADVYRDGIRKYLGDHAYANTVTADLWRALGAVSGIDVGALMDTWVLQGGHPTVTSRNGMLSQAPFQFGPPEGDSAIGSSWQIPVLSRPLAGGDTAAQLLGDTPAPLATAAPAIVNAGGTGVYRTSYASAELSVLAASLSSLTELERTVLVGDTCALALAGERSVSDVLTLASGLSTVIEPSVWVQVESFLDLLDRFVTDAQRTALQKKTTELFAPVFDRLGWEATPGEDERAPLVRATAVRALGTIAADDAVRREAAARFDTGVVDGDLADAVIAVVASMARSGDYDEMVARFRTATDPQEERRYRTGIASIADERLALATFGDCFELFRIQDVPFVIATLLSNQSGGTAVWTQLSERWEATLSRIPALMQSALASRTATFIDDRAFAERVIAFHRANPLETGQRHVEQALERMLTGVAFAERARPTLDADLA